MHRLIISCSKILLHSFNERRREICNKYDNAFKNISQVLIPIDNNSHYHSRHLYPLLIEINCLKIDRAAFIEELKKRNIGSTVHYVPIHMHPYYRDRYHFDINAFPNAKWIYERTITLPLFPKMTDNDIDDVINSVEEIIQVNKKD